MNQKELQDIIDNLITTNCNFNQKKVLLIYFLKLKVNY